MLSNEYYDLTDNGIFLQKLIIRGLGKFRLEEIVIIIFLLLMSLIRLSAGFSLLPKESMYLLLVRFSDSRFSVFLPLLIDGGPKGLWG